MTVPTVRQTSVARERGDLVHDVLSGIVPLVEKQGATRQTLAELERRLGALSSRADLFPAEHFPIPPGGRALSYRLWGRSEGVVLMLVHGSPGHAAAPHNHRTWATLAGVTGQEQQVNYVRTDDRSVPNHGTLEETERLVLGAGTAVSYLPDEFHAIAVVGGTPSMALHLYGRSLESITDRIRFQGASGGSFAYYRTNRSGTPRIGAAELRGLLEDGGEIAVLDVREEGAFGHRGHLLRASNAPYSRLEERVAQLVPRTHTLTVVCDADGGWLAADAARRLHDLGRTNVVVLDGGVEGWERAGLVSFTGVNVVSKALGEHVQDHDHTPRLTASDLAGRRAQGAEVLVVDARPAAEHAAVTVPGSVNAPGPELAYRIGDLVRSPDTLVVVHCAGRTRGIVGAQALIDAGVTNPVAVLENGIAGWRQAGQEPEHGASSPLAGPSPAALEQARQSAASVAKRFDVPSIDADVLARLAVEDRTLHVLDVRPPEEYATGHLPGAVSAPGGQLVQKHDEWIAVRTARVVLTDGGDGIRATLTAAWLRRLGLDAHVLVGHPDATAEAGVPAPRAASLRDDTELIAPQALRAMLARDTAVVVDVAGSGAYEAGHVPGAWWAVRARLVNRHANLPGTGAIVLTSGDGLLAQLAAGDLADAVSRPVLVLDGGTDAWRAAGFDLESGATRLGDEVDDFWAPPSDRATYESWFPGYVEWGQALADAMREDGTVAFPAFDESR